jgi:hypothetical protein
MRDVVYFHGHGSAHALIVLALYAVLGAGAAFDRVHTEDAAGEGREPSIRLINGFGARRYARRTCARLQSVAVCSS